MDLVLSLVALLVLSPVLLATSLAIALESGFPVLFRQTRLGLHGREFGMFKFRSMVKNAAAIGPYFTSTSDPRITRVGRLIRRTSIDELPQILNVLRGDMSLVGPRPDVPAQRSALQRCRLGAALQRAPRHHRAGAGAAAFRGSDRGAASGTGPALHGAANCR
jgi:lipopolysaccharide/colanic/teichoic acid biosynthesis glycosyltransferase